MRLHTALHGRSLTTHQTRHLRPNSRRKPPRIRMTHDLVVNYGLYKQMHVERPEPATAEQMARFHSQEYVDFLCTVKPETVGAHLKQLARFNVGDDCPLFDGLYQFCQASVGGSLRGAVRLNEGDADVAINWAGGLHHAKKCEASGFCYANDIVLAILELLRHHRRVLYIDIDIHHGDGVEEAFYTTDRVMTCSFHKFGKLPGQAADFFPGTGDLRDTGAAAAKGYSVNFPLQEGMNDASYEGVFKPVVRRIVETFQPNAVVLQCGADSLAGDRLGCFNLTLRGHAACVQFVLQQQLPTLILGGGGYTVRNVARCWTLETAAVLGVELDDDLPTSTSYHEYYAPEYKLHIQPSPTMENMNLPDNLETIKQKVFENLRALQPAPNVQMHHPPR